MSTAADRLGLARDMISARALLASARDLAELVAYKAYPTSAAKAANLHEVRGWAAACAADLRRARHRYAVAKGST